MACIRLIMALRKCDRQTVRRGLRREIQYVVHNNIYNKHDVFGVEKTLFAALITIDK